MAQTSTESTIDADSGSLPTDRAAARAHETIERVTATASRAGHEARAAATRAVEMAKNVQDEAVAAGGEGLRRVRSFVERNPLTAVGIAAGVGALLTALVRR
jgi:ElaB/YqjD/DUF883 family membrane-anchored ribosome-binding protein